MAETGSGLLIVVLTVSDRAAAGVYPDRSGPVLRDGLREVLPEAQIRVVLVPDEADAITAAVLEAEASGCRVLLACGGTGLGPRDITPETLQTLCPRSVPGIAERYRRASEAETPFAPLSRVWAGQRGRMLCIALPGSTGAARLAAALIGPLLPHAVSMMDSGGH